MELINQFQVLRTECQQSRYPSLKDRKNVLISLRRGLQTEAYSLASAVNKDFTHRSVDETLFLEIFPTINAINFCLKQIKKWMKPRARRVSWLFMPAYAYVIPQPLGVIGNLVPWNYPIYLALVPAIYALAAGNRVMVKMSELSPHTGMALQTFIHSLGLGAYLAIVDGDVNVSKQFAALPFNHLLFTGSTAVGKLVMKAASEHLTPVTLELGGKSPAIVSPTMNTKYFNRLFMGKLFNAAQTCIAPDYLLVPKGWEHTIEKECRAFIDRHYPKLMENDNYSSIISREHKKRLLELLEDARAKGARIVQFGDLKLNDNKMPLYLIFDVNSTMRVMHEEIFGPILPILNYNTLNDAIEYINSAPNPLALYYFGEDKVEQRWLQNTTLSGALTINDTLMHIAINDLPFGGVGLSGMGQYHGKEGFDTFSKLKPVFVQRKLSPVTWLYPPYGKLLRHFLFWIGGIKTRTKE